MAASPNLAELVDRMPSPSDAGQYRGILSNADKEAMDKALEEIHAGGRENVVALAGMLVENDPPADSKVRHALHALAIQAGGWKPDERKAYVDALASTLGGDRPKEVQAFVIRQIQLAGGKDAVPALARLLADEDLCTPAATALLAIRDGAADAFRVALSKATGRTRVTIVQAVGTLKDKDSVEPLRKLAASDDRDTRQVASWALANIGDPGAVDLVIKNADAAEGFDRIELTRACLLLADNLTAAGKKDEATRVYAHLRDTRKDKSEAYVRDLAAKALEGTK